MIVKKDLNENGEEIAPVRKNLGERIREKWHNTVYSNKKEEEKTTKKE